jgi:acyl-CoA thioesterase-1
MNRPVTLGLCALLMTSLFMARRAQSATSADESPKTIVACVGDSITQGSGTKNPRLSSYPAQLRWMLGEAYTVNNFGVGGTTLLNGGDHPYQKTGAFKRALASKANVVVIMLGTNDTKKQNWQFKDQFVSDYKDLIGQFAALESKPKIFICLPPPVPKTGNYDINEAGVQDQIPLIKQLAESEHVQLIDNYAPLKDHPELLPDNVHPNEAGAELLARSVYHAITGTDAPTSQPADK